jgi:hypothetical protein
MAAGVILHRPNLREEYRIALNREKLKPVWIVHNLFVVMTTQFIPCFRNLAIHKTDHILKKIAKLIVSFPISVLVIVWVIAHIYFPCTRDKAKKYTSFKDETFLDELGNGELHRAISYLAMEPALRLIQNHPKQELVRQNNIGMTPLHSAILEAANPVTVALLDKLSRTDRSIQDVFGNTALHLALLAYPATSATATTLLGRVTTKELEIRNKDGITPHMIIKYRQLRGLEPALTRIYNRAAPGILAAGLTAARIHREPTPAGRCATHRLFDANVLGLISQFAR